MKLDRLVHFAAVVQAGSFTGAAQRLGVTKAVVSTHVARLEEELGTALLTRSTRQVHMTDAGRSLYARTLTILREAEEATSEIADSLSEPRGTLRLTAPVDYSHAVLIAVIAEFRRRHPACAVDLELSDSLGNIASGDRDMAIRLGWPRDSSLNARRIGAFRQYLLASPDLAPMPEHPDDLHNLPFIANSSLPDPLAWNFRDKDGIGTLIRMTAAVRMNTTPAVLQSLRRGMGIGILPDFLAQDSIEKGLLIRLLPDWSLEDGGIHIVYPPVRFRPARVKIFTRMLFEAENTRQYGSEGNHKP